MEFYLNCGAAGAFGGLLDRFIGMGFRGCRFDVLDEEQFKENITELAYHVSWDPRVKHIYLINGLDVEEVLAQADLVIAQVNGLGLQNNVVIEVLNEPTLNDTWKNKPDIVGELTKRVWQKTKSNGLLVLAGAGHSITPEIFKFSEKVLTHCPLEIGFAFHRYATPDLTQPVSKSWSRAEEVEQVARLGEGRIIYGTESGQSELQGKKKHWYSCNTTKYWLSEDEVTRQIASEAYFWANTNLVAGYTFYQLNDGNNPNDREDHFGWRHFEEAWDGQWKVVAQIMPDILKELDPVAA